MPNVECVEKPDLPESVCANVESRPLQEARVQELLDTLNLQTSDCTDEQRQKLEALLSQNSDVFAI